MECRIKLAATLLDRGFINLDPSVSDNFCHVCLGEEVDSKCFQGKAFAESISWLICDECISKVMSTPKEMMFFDDVLLKQKLEEDDVLLKHKLEKDTILERQMECRIKLAATLLDRGFIIREPEVNADFCHACLREEIKSKCYQGKAFDNSISWLICDECIRKVMSLPKEKMFLTDVSLKYQLEEDAILERQLDCVC